MAMEEKFPQFFFFSMGGKAIFMKLPFNHMINVAPAADGKSVFPSFIVNHGN